jgi:hypothetical protein
MSKTPSDSRAARRRTTLLLIAATLAVFMAARGCVGMRGIGEPATAKPARVGVAQARNPAPAPAPAPAATPALTSAPSTSAPGAAVATAETYRLRALTFTMDAGGVRLDRSVVAPGRAKAPPRSIEPYRLEFEVYDARGEKRYAGSIDHPLHRRFEYEDPAQPGALRAMTEDVADEVFQIRLPDTFATAQIAFFEVQPAAGGFTRTALGTVALP